MGTSKKPAFGIWRRDFSLIQGGKSGVQLGWVSIFGNAAAVVKIKPETEWVSFRGALSLWQAAKIRLEPSPAFQSRC